MARGWVGVKSDEMEPAQGAVEVLGGDAASASEEVLEAGAAVVDGLDVEFADVVARH